MRSIAHTQTTKNKTYPKLMISTKTDTIVLMVRHSEGFIVHDNHSVKPIGDYSETWIMNNFVDYNGVVELSN